MGRMPVRTWDGSTEALADVAVEDVSEVVGTAVARYLGVTAVHAEDMRDLLRACAAPPEAVRPAGAARALVELVDRHGAVVHRLELAEVVAEFPRVLRWRGRVFVAVPLWSTSAQFVETTEMEVGDDVAPVAPVAWRTPGELAAHVAEVSGGEVQVVGAQIGPSGLSGAHVHVAMGVGVSVMVEWEPGRVSGVVHAGVARTSLGPLKSVEDLFAAVRRFLGHD